MAEPENPIVQKAGMEWAVLALMECHPDHYIQHRKERLADPTRALERSCPRLKPSRKKKRQLTVLFCCFFYTHTKESLCPEGLANSQWSLSIVQINSGLHLLFLDLFKAPIAIETLLLICKMALKDSFSNNVLIPF